MLKCSTSHLARGRVLDDGGRFFATSVMYRAYGRLWRLEIIFCTWYTLCEYEAPTGYIHVVVVEMANQAE